MPSGHADPAPLDLSRSVVEVAPELLGALLVGDGVIVRLTEVEAYAGTGEDPGSHAHRGPTPRTEVMFGPAGRAYVYLSYGIHSLLNAVAEPEGEAAAVLILQAALDEERTAGRPPGEPITQRRRRPKTKGGPR